MILEASAVEKWYLRGKGESNRFFAVRKTDLTLVSGKVTVLTGRSGSGKTTLMNMMAGLLTPDSGKVILDGQDLYAMKDDALSRLRNQLKSLFIFTRPTCFYTPFQFRGRAKLPGSMKSGDDFQDLFPSISCSPSTGPNTLFGLPRRSSGLPSCPGALLLPRAPGGSYTDRKIPNRQRE